MKTTIEVGGFEVKIEELDGKLTVVAEKDGEVVEEFELDTEDLEGDGSEPAFDGDEDDDFEDDMDDDMGGEEDEEDDFEEDESDLDDQEGKLESFSHFVKRRKK